MSRRARCSSSRGLLLVEAVLSAVVIAVGLVFISQGLSSQLKALRTMEEYDTLLALARRKWLELEAERLSHLPVAQEARAGSFDAQGTGGFDTGYRWTIAAIRRPQLGMSSGGSPLFSEVTLTIRRAVTPNAGAAAGNERRSAAVILAAIWPSEWVPEEWLN
ncbi:MAG: hypothetical protein HYY90_03405 [Candidatus Omnitrophica bacterium]|nr:hypothetical protein [Candidatus Omnitrophota bacterium]